LCRLTLVFGGSVGVMLALLISEDADRTYCTVNDKTQYTVDKGEKEKGKTIVS
jgi:hypothetical protein